MWLKGHMLNQNQNHIRCELLWLKIIVDDLKFNLEGPMKLYCDYKSAIDIVNNPI